MNWLSTWFHPRSERPASATEGADLPLARAGDVERRRERLLRLSLQIVIAVVCVTFLCTAVFLPSKPIEGPRGGTTQDDFSAFLRSSTSVFDSIVRSHDRVAVAVNAFDSSPDGTRSLAQTLADEKKHLLGVPLTAVEDDTFRGRLTALRKDQVGDVYSMQVELDDPTHAPNLKRRLLERAAASQARIIQAAHELSILPAEILVNDDEARRRVFAVTAPTATPR